MHDPPKPRNTARLDTAHEISVITSATPTGTP